MRKKGIIIPLIIIVIASVFIITYINRNQQNSEAFPEEFFEEKANVEWLGIYLKGHKVGYLASRIDSTETGYRVYSYMYMKVSPTSGFEREVSYKTVANTERDYNLKDFEFRMVSGDYIYEASGYRKKDKLIVDMKGKNKKMEIPLESPYIPATIEGMVKTGKTGEFQFFDPTLQSLFTIKVNKIGKDTLNNIPTTKYSVTQSGINIFFWISKEGKLIREESPIGLVMKRESSDVVSDIETAGFKLFDSYAIKTDRTIENPRSIKRLVVRLDSVNLSGLRIEDDRQSLKGNILTINKIEPGNEKEISEDVKSFLESTNFIPSDDSIIKETAEHIVEERKGWEAAKRIVTYVDTLLKDTPTFSIPYAIDAMKAREGDCNEHSALAVALLRAADIPSRVEVGLVYVAGAFYYHAWVGIYTGGKWISSDPTFGQYIADPTHIKLEYGGFDKQAKLYRVINKLKISILEYD